MLRHISWCFSEKKVKFLYTLAALLATIRKSDRNCLFVKKYLKVISLSSGWSVVWLASFWCLMQNYRSTRLLWAISISNFPKKLKPIRWILELTKILVIQLLIFFFLDERDAIQKKTFTKWVNKHLKKVRLTIFKNFFVLNMFVYYICLSTWHIFAYEPMSFLTRERKSSANYFCRKNKYFAINQPIATLKPSKIVLQIMI